MIPYVLNELNSLEWFELVTQCLEEEVNMNRNFIGKSMDFEMKLQVPKMSVEKFGKMRPACKLCLESQFSLFIVKMSEFYKWDT